MDKTAVLIPCFNEEKTIEKVVKDFRAALPGAVIYVYDNGSTDSTVRLAENAGAVVRSEPVRGKGNVIRRMFREIDALSYVLVDGDDTYPANDAGKMVDMVLNERVDMVVGDRLSSTYFTENKRRFHGFGNVLVRWTINRLFRGNVKDIMTGYRAFSYEFVKTFSAMSHGFEVETEMTIHALDKKMYVRNLVIDYKDRPEGSFSKLNTCSDGFRVLFTIAKLFFLYSPARAFCSIAALLMVLALGFLIPVFVVYYRTGLVPKFPTLIVCCFVMTISILSFFTGIQLQFAVQKQKIDFENNLLRIYREKNR